MTGFKRAFILFAIANLALNLFMFILVIMPRQHTRRIRHALARLVINLWVGTSRVWSMLHEDLWQRGNGH